MQLLHSLSASSFSPRQNPVFSCYGSDVNYVIDTDNGSDNFVRLTVETGKNLFCQLKKNIKQNILYVLFV